MSILNNRILTVLIAAALIFAGFAAVPASQETPPVSASIPAATPLPTPVPAAPAPAPNPTPEPTPSPTPAPTMPPLVGIEFTPELIAELAELQYSSETYDDLRQEIDEFTEKHTDFISDFFFRISYSDSGGEQDGGEHAMLLLPKNRYNDEMVINQNRLERFVKNCEQGIPDTIVHVSNIGMVSPYLVIFSYPAPGDYYTVTGCSLDSNDKPAVSYSYTVKKPVDTGKEWIMITERTQKIRYPKYGYEPIPPEVPQGMSPEKQALEFVKKLQNESQYLREYSGKIELREPQEVNGKLCYLFDFMCKDNELYPCGSYAVAQDMSSYYDKEYVNGYWVLHARPKSAP